jgi:hypothetical protein
MDMLDPGVINTKTFIIGLQDPSVNEFLAHPDLCVFACFCIVQPTHSYTLQPANRRVLPRLGIHQQSQLYYILFHLSTLSLWFVRDL